LGSRCWAFTSGDYWFRVVARGLVRGGDLSSLGGAWVVGLGIGFEEFPRLLRGWGIEYEDVSGSAHVFRTYRLRLAGGGEVALIASAGGGGYAEAVAAMASEAGVKALVGVGLCGALGEGLKVGDVVIPTGCVREDGVTGKYVGPGYPAVPDYGLLKRLESSLRGEGLNPIPGLVVTTSSTFREGRDWAEGLWRVGALCVECEAAVIMTLARLCRVPAAVALVVSDSVVRGEEAFSWGELRVRLKESLAKTLRAALEAAGLTP